LASNLDRLASNLVLGLFLWDNTSSDSFHREIDVELGRWGRDDNEDAQFVIQPYNLPDHTRRFRLPAGLEGSLYTFTWEPGRVSFLAEGVRQGGAIPIQERAFERMVPEPGNERPRINLWCTDSRPPADGTAEVVVSEFTFTPLSRK